MMAGVIAFFQALPALISLISRLGLLFESLVKHAEQNNINGWIDELEKRIDELKQAKSSDEKFKAAQNLVGIIRGIGPQ